MRIKDSFTSVRVQMPGRRVAFASLLLAALALAVSILLGPPVQIGLPRMAPPAAAVMVPLIGGVLPLLALLASALGLFGASQPSGKSAPGVTENASSQALLTGLQAVVQELSGLLAKERSQAAALQRSCTAATQEAAVVSARVARIADAAIDAETRLVAGVAQAEKALKQPAAVVNWAAEAVQRVERAIPELAELIRSNSGTPSDPAYDAAAGRLTEAVDRAVQTFRGAIDDASGQINALGEISVALRRDAIALDLAGREIATAGATVVARAGETVGQVDAVLATLPDAVATVTTAAEQISRTLDDASATLRSDGAAVSMAGQEIVAERQAIQTAVGGIQTAVDQIATVIASIDAARQDAAGMAELTERLREAAGALADGTNSLDQAGHRVAGRLDYACEEIWAASDKMVAQVAGALAPLPDAAAAVVTAADQAAQSLAETLREAAGVLAEGTSNLNSAGHRVAERFDTTCESIAAASDNMVAHIAGALAPLAPTAGSVIAAAQQAAQTLTEVSALLCADSAALEASGRVTLQAAATLLQEAETLHAAGQAMSGSERQAIEAVTRSVEAASARLAAIMAEAERARRDVGSLAEITTTLEHATAHLVDGADTLASAGQRIATAGENVSNRLAADASRNEAVMHILPEVAAEVAAAVNGLRQETQTLVSVAQQFALSGSATTSAISDVAAHADSAVGSLESIARTIGTAGADLATQISRLGDVTDHAGAQMALLPEVASQIAAAVSHLRAVISAMPTNLSDAAARMEAATPRLDVLEALGQRLQDVVARLPTELAGQIADAVPASLSDTAARLTAAVPRIDHLETLSLRLETITARLPAEAAQEASMARLATLSDTIGETARRVEGALAEHDASLSALVASIKQTQLPHPASAGADCVVDAADADTALAATLSHLDGVAVQTEMLLRQTEALAEAVMDGRAPGLSMVLADHTPTLLAGVETTTRRLRSVATALALASDGPPTRKRRLV
jgi:uncharacterized phage infection (PIP) family protein YhgE